MKTIKSVIATTRVDRHGDVITEGALRDMADQMAQYYIPMQYNHDPRIPPLGRTIDAFVRKADDGAYELVGITELFEPGTVTPLNQPRKRMQIRNLDPGRLALIADRSYSVSDDWAVLRELAEDMNADLETHEKKAAEPLSVLIFAIGAGTAALASGFLNKMGSDAWDAVKPKLARLLGNKRDSEDEFLFILELQLERNERTLSVQCILANPSDADLVSFWEAGIYELKQQLPHLLTTDSEIVRVVLHYKNQSLVPGFAVRSDCVPCALEAGSPEAVNRDEV